MKHVMAVWNSDPMQIIVNIPRAEWIGGILFCAFVTMLIMV